jgi:hypothetical protein
MIYPARTAIEARRVPVSSTLVRESFNCAGGVLCVMLCILCAPSAAARDYAISWHWPTNQATAATMQRYPWLRLEPERVNLAISYNGGTAYTDLARGVPSAYGTNTYAISLPDSPAWASTNARIRVQTPARYPQPQTTATAAITICAIHLVTPPTTVTNGSQVQLRWTAAGAGPLIQLGYQVTGAISWQPTAVFGNQDSSQGATTNTATWYADGLQPGPGRIVLQSMSDTNIARIASIEVAP